MSDDDKTVTLATTTDVYNFHVGSPIQLVMTPGGGVRLATRRERMARWIRGRWLNATRWFRPRTVTSAIDVEAGSITLATERWSWRRWRWERM